MTVTEIVGLFKPDALPGIVADMLQEHGHDADAELMRECGCWLRPTQGGYEMCYGQAGTSTDIRPSVRRRGRWFVLYSDALGLFDSPHDATRARHYWLRCVCPCGRPYRRLKRSSVPFAIGFCDECRREGCIWEDVESGRDKLREIGAEACPWCGGSGQVLAGVHRLAYQCDHCHGVGTIAGSACECEHCGD